MNRIEVISKAYAGIARNEHITVWHLSIYTTLLYLWVENNYINPITITRKKVMKLAHINSIVTYHKCIKQLQEFGYILYVPSYNYFLGSRITLILHQ